MVKKSVLLLFLGGRGSLDDGDGSSIYISYFFRSFQKVGIDEDLNHRNVLEFTLESSRSAFPIIFHRV